MGEEKLMICENLTCVECGAGYNDHCECGDPDCEIGHGNGSCRNCGDFGNVVWEDLS